MWATQVPKISLTLIADHIMQANMPKESPKQLHFEVDSVLTAMQVKDRIAKTL